MENGDWKGVLQHRLPGICPDYLDLLLVVARSGGSNVPPAVHVSSGKHRGAVVRDTSGARPLGCGVRDASITALM